MSRNPAAEQAPTVVGALPPAVTDLLTAVVEALTVPLPTIDERDEQAYHQLLEHRTSNVRIVLASILDFPDVPTDNDPRSIRTHTAATPVTYALYEPETEHADPAVDPTPVGPGCGAPATARIEGYSPRNGRMHGSLDLAVYCCERHISQARDTWLGNLLPHTTRYVVDARCGQQFDFTTLDGGGQ